MKALICLMVMVFVLTAAVPAYVVKFAHDSRIVFTSDMGGNTDIYLLSRNRLERLTDHRAVDVWPVPDAKGEKIVFASNRGGSFDIFLMDLKSRKVERLTRDSRDELSPSWSADGRYVYYELTTGKNRAQIQKLDLKTRASAPLLPDPPFSSIIVPFANPNGDEIFFTGKVFLGWLVAKYNLNSRKYTELTKRGSCRPKVSPDGRKIAYVCHDDDDLGDVFLMNPDGSGKRNVTRQRSDTYDYYPSFSPQGDMIVFSSSPKSKGKNAYQLHTLDLKTGAVKKILSSAGNDSFPYWFK
jgi:Tol biopolymer transport system component